MKHFRVISILVFILFGCEKENEFSDEGLIIGEWEGYFLTATFEDGTIEILPRNNCEGNIFEFKEDGTAFWLDFVQESEFNCLENLNTSQSARWNRIANEKFFFTLTNPNDDSEQVIAPDKILFGEYGERSMTMYFSTLPPNVPEEAKYFGITYDRQVNSE